MNYATKLLTIGALSAAFSSAALAATQGKPGDTSTGTTVVNADVPALIRIFNLADIDLGTYNPTNNVDNDEGLSGSTDVCVLMNNGTTYNVTVTADTGAFQLDSATASDSVAFTATYNGAALTYSTALANQTPDSAQSLGVSNCDDADANELVINIDETVLEDALAADDYTATLTLLVAED